MGFDTALRLTEILLALAMIQQSLEHLVSYPDERRLHGPRLGLCLLLLAGFHSDWVIWALMGLALLILHRFQGPYNGGSDKMTVLILTCLALVHLAPSPRLAELAFAYLGVQLVLSYFISGWIKVINPAWRSGEALADVFRFSAYPVSEGLRGWADRPRALFLAGWAVMGLELAFPLALLHPLALAGALVLTASFHFSNACFFGLNRFFWIWLAAYPSILWLQGRLVG
ncbi:HTTM domain-containing protein [Tropicibacter oceani]|uniref:HTTM domain-containing protein n=1 Tax=Tropicibacter oceani TaxID=3058420 RepID=A0ABY8QKB7_9RHOB|nr:HTTM domain-containing protein [Tropicibacter oceani]WGW04446.1 HTTM domain-containing protein [Tropicibacter oceani]